jgi:hypothetical protein
MTSLQNKMIERWSIFIKSVKHEVVDMKSSSRRLNMNWFIWQEIIEDSTCKSNCALKQFKKRLRFTCEYWAFRWTASWNEDRTYEQFKKKWSSKWWFYRVSRRSREENASHAFVWFIRQSLSSQSFTTISFDTHRMSDWTASAQRRHNSWKYKKSLWISFSKAFESFLWKYWKKKRTFNSFIFICLICKLQFEIDWINTNIERW